MRKQYISAFSALVCSLVFAGCAAEPPEKDYAIRLKDREEFLMDEFLLLDTNALALTVENYGHKPTGPLSISIDGAHPGSFTVSPVNLSSIPPGETSSFTVQPKEGTVQVRQNAVIEIINAIRTIDTAVTVYYREFPGPINKSLLFGSWSNSNTTMIVGEYSFIFRWAGRGIDVTSTINSWSQEEWTIGQGDAAGAPGTTLVVYRINCTVDEVIGYDNPSNYTNALFNLYPQPSPQESGHLSEGQEFSVWLLCKDWYTTTGAGASGINIGIYDYSRRNHVPWGNFLP